MTTAQPASSLSGTMRAQNGKGTVRMEDVYDTSAADLWAALTSPDRLARWLAEVSGDLRLGGRFQARFTSGWEGPGRIDVCEPHRRLLATMSPGEDDETEIEATLVEVGDAVQLVVEERGLPLGSLPAYGAGWQVHVEDLSGHLAGRERRPWVDRWTELAPHYRQLWSQQ